MDWFLIFSVMIALQDDPRPGPAEMKVLGVFDSLPACRREAAAMWQDVRKRPEDYKSEARRLLGDRKGVIDFEMSCVAAELGSPL